MDIRALYPSSPKFRKYWQLCTLYSCTTLCYISQVLISGLADTWSARNAWTPEQLLMNYGDITFRLSQRSPRKITMKFKDYVSYMQIQHDEDPLYVFDDKVSTKNCLYSSLIVLAFFFYLLLTKM